MVAVGFLGVSGTLRPAHGEIREAYRGDIRKIVDRVVEQGDGVAEDTADDFGANKAESGGHSPAKNAGAEGRVLVAVVAVAVAMRMAVTMRMSGVR